MAGVDSAAMKWGSSGLAWLTGMPDGPPDFSRANVLTRAERVADDFRRAAGVAVDAATTLAGRSALLGLGRGGRTSAGGATRLLAGPDGWCAITLSRADDVQTVPALLEAAAVPDDPWPVLRQWVADVGVRAAVERARLLGIPAAVLGETPASAPVVRGLGPAGPACGLPDVLVVDLSSMWAGPLCGQLLAQGGATVVKVESPSRPDGTRRGDRAFFDWMNGGKLSYAADFDVPGPLRHLLAAADVVIEGSRPAALARRRLGPDDVAPRPGRVWLRITGHGTDGENADRVAFGDDAAVSGGLVGTGTVFCGDAIADPLTGLEAALAVAESLGRGGGELIEVSMAAVAATYAALPPMPALDSPVRPPLPPPPAFPASDLGADNVAVERLVAERRLAPC